MSLFDDNKESGISLCGEHITTDILHDIMNKRTMYDKHTPKDKWDTLLWRIYEYVKYEQGTDTYIETRPASVGVKYVYNPHTYCETPEWEQFREYFHKRGFSVYYDSLNNIINIRW